ncbi:MAG: 2-dehydropantoate 2-reductase, partial [Clostridia bacterium]|nr:2-dehydropantoate 2-reductase [Clostridia bacterium]
MKIAVIGAGAMGASIGAYAQQGGADVYFVDPFKEHIEAIRENGLKIVDVADGGKTLVCHGIKAYTDASQIGETMDYIFYQVKGMYMDDAIEGAKCLGDDYTCHLSLQNGVGNVEKLQAVYPDERVFYGLVSAGAKMLGPGAVERNFDPQKSFISIGSAAKRISLPMQALKGVFDKTVCAFNLVEDIDPVIWKKMINNCTGNAICSVARIPLGRLYNHDDGAELSEMIEKEIREVAAAQGITIPETPRLKGKFPPEFPHIPSTAQDVIAKRRTEIDTLNGAVCRLGRKYGVPTPYNDAMVMLIRLIEDNYKYMLGVQ